MQIVLLPSTDKNTAGEMMQPAIDILCVCMCVRACVFVCLGVFLVLFSCTLYKLLNSPLAGHRLL